MWLFFFFLSYMEEISDLSPAQREKHLAAWRKTGCVASVASQKERNSSSKRQEAQRMSKINKWKESVPLLWWRDDVTVAKASALHRQDQLRRGSSSSLVSLPWWPWACPLLWDPGTLQTLRESVSTRTNSLLFLIILCTLPKEEMELLQELTVFWVQKR